MKKSTTILLKFAIFALLFYGCFFLIISIFTNKTPDPITDITTVFVEDIKEEWDSYYIEELHVLKRYAFVTEDVYYDSESGYEDITYRVYAGDEAMDKYDLFNEHYIVMFYDNSGTPHLASMSVSASKNMSTLLNTCEDASYSLNHPLTISACVGAANDTKETFTISRDEDLHLLKEEHLNAYSLEHDIPYEGIQMSYKYETLEDYTKGEVADASHNQRLFLICGILFLVGGICSIKYYKKKKSLPSSSKKIPL